MLDFILRTADNALILGHRLSEWCGHGPVLEQDIAMTNIALDLVGQARSLYQLAAEVEGQGRGEDDFAYLRDVFDFKNVLLVEQPNGDFAHTIARQFYFSAFQLPFYQNLIAAIEQLETSNAALETLKGIAEKAVKEVAYHLRWSSEWVIRLGDGTEESHQRMQKAVDNLWAYAGEVFITDEIDQNPFAQFKTQNSKLKTAPNTEGVVLDWLGIKKAFDQTLNAVLAEANLQKPTTTFAHKGGKNGRHSEHLGYILAEMQFLQRAYPNSEW
jgi:ring-1,2-phenylacetyl-CoA epoxidase subunit PaaC